MIKRRQCIACILWLVGQCIVGGAWADQLDDIVAARKLRVAIIDGLPHFSYQHPQQGFVGSDVETARLLAKDLGVTIEFVTVPNAERIETLLARRADLVISALSITPAREQVISFSLPYSQIALVVAAPRSISIYGYQDLTDKRVGVGSKTSNGELLKTRAPNARLVEYPDEQSLLDAYVKGDFDIVSMQRADIEVINRRAPARSLEEKFVQQEFDIGIGIRKDERRLRGRINTWISNRLADGSLNEIFRRHHGRDLPESVLPRSLTPKG